MSETTSDRIEVQCACGVKLKVPASAAGRRARCPKCSATFAVPAPAGQGITPSGDGWLDELAAQERTATSTPPAESAATGTPAEPRAAVPTSGIKPCPHCGAALVGDAVLCTSCGYSLKTGQTKKGARLGPSVAGRFALGCVLSAVGAVVGAAVWYFVAMKVNLEIGYIAWGIGLVTGFGMALGYRTPGVLPGIVAAATSLLSILVAKMLIFLALVFAVLTGQTRDRAMQEAFVVRQLTAESLQSRGIDPARATERQWNAEYEAAKARVARMSAYEFQRELERCREVERASEPGAPPRVAGNQDASRDAPPSGGEEREDTDERVSGLGTVLGLYVRAMFRPLDVLFVLLAIASAYKIGSSRLVFGGSS